MIRVRVENQDDDVILIVEGRLTGMFVPELEQCWRQQTAGHSRHVIVDVKSVLSIDQLGRRLLSSMYESGVRFRGAGMSMQDELAAIAQAKEK